MQLCESRPHDLKWTVEIGCYIPELRLHLLDGEQVIDPWAL
jgi:hypothetical protein